MILKLCVFIGKTGGSVAIHSFKISPECLLWALYCSRSWEDLLENSCCVLAD